MRIINALLSLTLMAVFFVTPTAFAGDGSNIYWVSGNGTASWSNCESASPLSGTSACSLSTANSNAIAGDTINLRAGTYSTNIWPSNSGSAGNIITYQAYNSEVVTIDLDKTTCDEANTGFSMSGKSYIKVDGLILTDLARLGNFKQGAHHNEISNNTIDAAGSTCGDMEMYFRTTSGGQYSEHNWIHDNTIHDGGYTSAGGGCNDVGGVIKFGDDVYNGSPPARGDRLSGNNTFEDNTVYNGSHHTMRVASRFNVIRNNTFRSYGWMTNPGGCDYQPSANGKYGGRNITIVDYYDTSRTDFGSGLHNVIENNKFAHAGKPPDDDGGHNLVLFSPDNILRYNYIFGAAMQGIYIRGTAPDDNMIYNNTIVQNGYEGYELLQNASHDGAGIGAGFGGLGNVIKNNIVYGNYGWDGGNPEYINHDFINLGGNTVENNWATDSNDSSYLCSGCYGDPQFVNGSGIDIVANKENVSWWPDLTLQGTSGAINKGAALTTVSTVTSQTNITLADASYFQDGSWGSSLSDIQADYIAIGTVINTAQITSISGNIVTLESAPISTINTGDNVWLYKDSDGTRVFDGSAPDLGAYESPTPSAPKNLRIIGTN